MGFTIHTSLYSHDDALIAQNILRALHCEMLPNLPLKVLYTIYQYHPHRSGCNKKYKSKLYYTYPNC